MSENSKQPYYNMHFLFNKFDAITSRFVLLKKKNTPEVHKINTKRFEQITCDRNSGDYIYTFEELMPFTDNDKLDVILDVWYEKVYNLSAEIKSLEILPYMVAEKLFSDVYSDEGEILNPELRPGEYNLYRTVLIRLTSEESTNDPLGIKIFAAYRRLTKSEVKHIPYTDFIKLRRF